MFLPPGSVDLGGGKPKAPAVPFPKSLISLTYLDLLHQGVSGQVQVMKIRRRLQQLTLGKKSLYLPQITIDVQRNNAPKIPFVPVLHPSAIIDLSTPMKYINYSRTPLLLI